MKKVKAIFCVLFGHSNIVDNCMGYITCSRCGVQLGDTLASSYNNPKAVVTGHNCPTCKDNYKSLTWKDKFLSPNPFKS